MLAELSNWPLPLGFCLLLPIICSPWDAGLDAQDSPSTFQSDFGHGLFTQKWKKVACHGMIHGLGSRMQLYMQRERERVTGSLNTVTGEALEWSLFPNITPTGPAKCL